MSADGHRMVLFWAQDVLLIIWTFAFITSDFFYERYTQRSPRPASVAVPSYVSEREKIGDLPNLLAQALAQVENKTFDVTRDHVASDAWHQDHRVS
jgi:hypothetical protein